AVETGEQWGDVARLEAQLRAKVRGGLRIGQDRHEFVNVADLERPSLAEPVLAQADIQLGLRDPVRNEAKVVGKPNPKQEWVLARENLRVRDFEFREPVDFVVRQTV